MKEAKRNEKSKTSRSEDRELARWALGVLRERRCMCGFLKLLFARALEDELDWKSSPAARVEGGHQEKTSKSLTEAMGASERVGSGTTWSGPE